VRERLFIRVGKQFRPFSTSAGIYCRGCSLPLQRVIVDFGADHAFGRASAKLREHYGINIPTSTIRRVTEHHARQMVELKKPVHSQPNQAGCAQPIGEMDGSMIPIVSVNEEAKDKRKHQTLYWKEVRLSLVHEQGSVTPKFGAVFQGSVDDAGQCWLNTAILAGFGHQTHLHAVGDGASWIAEQVQDKFGQPSSYLVDFYHVCDYLAAASPHCTPHGGESKDWLEEQKPALKNNQPESVIKALELYLEADEIEKSHAPVRACHRYLSNRSEPLDYQTAIDKGLPIGSGEIASAHRYVIQERLKRPGAWWKAVHANSMLALRVVRANQQWDDYWMQTQAA
jgi:hypothetical protein